MDNVALTGPDGEIVPSRMVMFPASGFPSAGQRIKAADAGYLFGVPYVLKHLI
jgi:hypothetical protein